MKTAIIIGATGLVGRELLKEALLDVYFDKLVIFVRRPSGLQHAKLTEEIVDFDHPEEWREKVKADVLFSALGTTMKKAGSKSAQYRVDYTYQYELAKTAYENGVSDYILVSAPGASPDARIFYSRIKGELDRDVKKLGFKRVIIFKPSILEGEREEKRTGEKFAAKFARSFRKIPGLRKYRPIKGHTVALAMINALKSEDSRRIQEYSLNEIFEVAGEDRD